MRKALVSFILKFHGRNTSKSYRIVSLIMGAIFFLVILPGIFIAIGLFTEEYIRINMNRIVEIIISVSGIITGLYYLIWSTLTQWKIGKGTPAPNAPTQNLIIVGPYKYCRNPIELGAIIYYLGIGTFVGGLITGIICSLMGFIVGSIYHKFVEEKELEERFGEEYRKYKSNTPFVFPGIKTMKKQSKPG